MKRGGHTICRLCTKKGELSEIVLTKFQTPGYAFKCHILLDYKNVVVGCGNIMIQVSTVYILGPFH